MADSNSYSFSTVSTTGMGVTNTSSTGSLSSSASVATIVQTSSPDDSHGLHATLGGEAAALGTNTLTAGNLSGTLIDGPSATSAELSASMVAASQSPTGTTLALAETYADIHGSPEVLVGASIQSASSVQGPTGNSSIATSTTDLMAYDIHPSTAGGGPVSGTDAIVESDPLTVFDYAHANLNIDGNVALIQFDAVAVGENTLVNVDAFVLALEDELSVSSGLIDLAIG
jgi:hypothetical protein